MPSRASSAPPLRRLEINDRLPRPGISQFLSRQPFESFGVVAQVGDRRFEQRLALLLGFDLRFKLEEMLPHARILLENRKVPKEYANQAGQHNQANHQL
jgi:hypothetical protein